jgi:hypothetical protein
VKRYSASEALNDPWIKRFSVQDSVHDADLTAALVNMRSFRVTPSTKRYIKLRQTRSSRKPHGYSS